MQHMQQASPATSRCFSLESMAWIGIAIIPARIEQRISTSIAAGGRLTEPGTEIEKTVAFEMVFVKMRKWGITDTRDRVEHCKLDKGWQKRDENDGDDGLIDG
jgi:hypothetical protein